MSDQTTPDALGNATEGAATPQQAAPELFTKSQIEAIIKKRLEEERGKYADYPELKAEVERRRQAEMSDAQRAEAKLKEMETALQAERQAREAETLKALRLTVALKKGIPATSAGRLVGTTEAEIEADADAFLSDLKAVAKPTPPDLDGAAGVGQRGTNASLTSQEIELANKMGMTPEQYAKQKARLTGKR